MRRFLFLAVLAAVTASMFGVLGDGGGKAEAALPDPVSPGRVLILGPTVSGSPSFEETKALLVPGVTAVDVVATFAGITATTGAPFDATKGFEAYRAIILGDPTCTGTAPTAAAGTAWQPVVRGDNGNVVIIGTDPRFHSAQGGNIVMEKGIAFAVADPGKTGAYITLSCYYDFAAAFTDVPLLDGLSTAGKIPALPDPGTPGGFTVTAVPGCFNSAHIVATHPALTSPPPLTDADLSNWTCSVHEAFDSWPTDFQVLAIALTGTAFTAADGTVGTPYILARGEELTPIGVGGIAELPAFAGTAPTSEGSSAAADYTLPIAAALAGVALTVAAGGWYARRRWLR